MKTKNYEKKTIVTHAYCDCGGEYYYNSGSLFTDMMTGKVLYVHSCRECGKKENLTNTYPNIREMEVEV